MKERILDWRNRRSWLFSLRYYANDLLTDNTRELINRERPKCWSDDLDWLPGHESIVPAFATRMFDYYSHVKAFHGCRPDTLRPFYSDGLQGQDIERIAAKFREIYADVNPSKLDRLIEDSKGGAEPGRIFLTADDRKMTDSFGHYVIHGSEYLQGLATKLGKSQSGEDYKMRLRKTGTPTVLEVDIPSTYLSHQQKISMAKLTLASWGQLLARRPVGTGATPCYVVDQAIPAECIKRHYHPSRILDVHSGQMYINQKLRCEMCA